MEQIVASIPKISSSDRNYHPVPHDQRLTVFKSNKVLAAIIVLSNYLHGSGGNSIHGRSASPLFLRGYDLSGITTLLSALIKRAYSSPKDTLKKFNEDVHKDTDINTDILNEIYNVHNTLLLNYSSTSSSPSPPTPLSTTPSLSSSKSSQSQTSIQLQSQSSIEPLQSQTSSSSSPQQKPTSPSLLLLSPPQQQKPPSSPKSSTLRMKTKRNSGRYLLWEEPPASFPPYVNTLKLSSLTSTSASPQPFPVNTTTTNENGADDDEDDSFIRRAQGGDYEEDDDNEDASSSLSTGMHQEGTFMGCLCTRVLLILKGFFCDFSTVKSCILDFKKDDPHHLSATDPLLDLLFLTPDTGGDRALQLVHMEALSALESFFVTASLSRPLLERLAAMRVVERLTDAISLQSGRAAAAAVSNRAIALLAQLLCTSSRLTPALVRAFRGHGGYGVLRGAFAAELDRTRGGSQGSRRRRKELLKVLHLLLYVGLDEPGNLDAIRLLVRLYVDSTDSFKSDLLSTLKGAAHIQNERCGSSILIEIFKLFDSVPSVEDRMSLLALVDETMGLRNGGNSLLTAYCSLVDKGRRPSTVVLAANHITKMLVSGLIPKESLETVDFLSVLHPYFVPPSDLPFKKVNINE